MNLVATTAVLALLLTFPATVLALGTETFGNAPAVKQPEWADGILNVVNLNSRVYSHWVNGNETFYYQGDVRALNEALRKYAAVKADVRQLILLPGSGKTQSFGGKAVAFDWQLHVPTGIYRAVTGKKLAVMTVYINTAKPRGPVDRKRVETWIAELDADVFETRQKAEQELRKLEDNAKPLLRAALKARPSLEAQRRIEGLLKRLPGIDADDLEIPKGVTAVSVDELLTTHFKDLKDSNQYTCSGAIQELSTLVAYSDKIVPALTEMLKKDKHEYLRRVSAGCLGRVGAEAKSAVATLKEGVDDANANVRNAFGAAVEQIEKAKVEPGREAEIKRKRAILGDINERKKALGS